MKLIDNGMDSLEKSIKALKNLSEYETNSSCILIENNVDNYKYKLKDIIINLHHSIEVLFKYLIKEKNKYLIYAKPDEIFKKLATNKENKINSNTISFLDSVYRVIVLYGVDITHQDLNRFIILNEIRNSLVHYEREFKDKEVEHLVALLLPTLLNILKDNIGSFDSWAKDNNIYTDTNLIGIEAKLWTIEYYYEFSKKWKIASINNQKLENDGSSKKEIFDNRDKYIDYLKCPVCNQELFHVIDSYMVDLESVIYLGNCGYCGVELNRSDAKFIAINFKNFENYKSFGIENISHIFIEILLLEDIGDDMQRKIMNTISENIDIFIPQLKIELYNLVEELCKDLGESVYLNSYYQYNDIMENIIVYEDRTIRINFFEYSKLEDINYKKVLYKVINIVDNLDKENILRNTVNTTYMDYKHGMYLDFDGNDIEKEITLEVNFEYDYIKDMLEI